MPDTRSALDLTTLLACVGLTLTTAGAQSLTTYGTGTPGTGGRIPALWATSTPRPGNPDYGLLIENGLPGATAVAFAAALRTQVTVGGVGVLIDFNTSLQLPLVTLDARGEAVYKLPIPTLPALVGVEFVQQAFIADAGGAPLGFSATQGLASRVVAFGLLVGTRSTGSANQPQIAIDLDSGTMQTFAQQEQTNVGFPAIYPHTRSHLLTGSGLSNKVALFDCEVFPPKFVSDFSTTNTPWAVQWNPDGQRVYIIEQGPTGSTPEGKVLWGNPLLPNFGQDFPGIDIALGVRDALRIEFTTDGNTGILGTLGLFGGGADLRRYDTNPGSPSYNTQVANLLTSGEFLLDMALIDDNRLAAAIAGFGAQVQVHIVDVNTMRIVKSFSKTPFGQVIRGMRADARGRWLYVGNAPSTRWNVTAGVLRIDIDPASPNYGQITNIAAGMQADWSVYDVEVSDAGDRLYAIAGTGIQTAFLGEILEYDTQSLQRLRNWNVDRLGNLYSLLIR